MFYKINLYVVNARNRVVEDVIIEKNDTQPMTVKEIKEFTNNGKYVNNILSEEVMVGHTIMSDENIIERPFILYTIKLK